MNTAEGPAMVELSWAAFALAAAAVTLAALVQSGAGLGFGLIAAPLLALVDPAFIPGTILFLGTTASALATLRERRAVNPRLTLAGLSGRLPGAIIAAAVLTAVSPALFQLLFAVLILAAVALSLKSPKVPPTGPIVFVAGVVSGVMGTLTAVGAPPFGIALQHAAAAELRATLNAVLFLGACLSMAMLALFGAFGVADILRGAALVPFAVLGFALSGRLVRHPEAPKLVRPAVLALCVGASVLLIARALLA
ncbi:MAG: sulfite exporter TauE/SafE family protein [Pseudomonadota bacterium]